MATQLELYRQHVGAYPVSLDVLVTCPVEFDLDAWGGPYIADPASLMDAWGNRLRYRNPGVHHANGYDLWSAGPDGVDGTKDDIRDWYRPD